MKQTIVEITPKTIWELFEVKNYLRVLHDDDDSLISSLLLAAVELAENFTGLSLNTRRIEIEVEKLSSVIDLRYKPIVEIVSFMVETPKGPKEIKDEFGQICSDGSRIFIARDWVGEKASIELLSGYKDIVPRSVQHGILLHIAAMYDGKENSSDISPEIRQLYQPYRMLKI